MDFVDQKNKIFNTMESIENSLNKLDEVFWENLKLRSQKCGKRISKFYWINNKYYKRNLLNDGNHPQIDEEGRYEIPYKRCLFHPSLKGRFGLNKLCVAYFSNDIVVNCCETIEQFRIEYNLSWNELREYLRGDFDPKPTGMMGYPIKVRISIKALILDLTKEDNPLIEFLSKDGQWGNNSDFFESIILEKNDYAYQQTQLISLKAYWNGFDGILYRSVRAPKDICLPDLNLVMFNEAYVIR